MQNPSVIRTKPTMAVSTPARELSWSFMLLVIICACVVAAGFFFAARQHFSSMEYGLKNSKLREQLQNLETEKRRLLLAREVASSPLAIRKAAHDIGLRNTPEIVAVQASEKQVAPTSRVPVPEPVKATAMKATDTGAVVRTVLTTPIQPKPTGETRSRIAEPSKDKDKKEKTEVAALLKLK